MTVPLTPSARTALKGLATLLPKFIVKYSFDSCKTTIPNSELRQRWNLSFTMGRRNTVNTVFFKTGSVQEGDYNFVATTATALAVAIVPP
jgi:hypothetical protein